MIRKIIEINADKCNGCGICASACHEGAIDIIDGKAVLVRENFCDGLGDCLPACPTNAISFVEREAPEYDEAAVIAAQQAKANAHAHHGGGCPGSAARAIAHNHETETNAGRIESHLSQWPCQIKLVPITAPYFQDADLLIAADCTAFAYGEFHRELIKDRAVLVGCPKLDSVDYTEKLSAIVAANSIKSVTIARMEVPCCSGLENAARRAVMQSGKDIPFNVVTVSIDGHLI